MKGRQSSQYFISVFFLFIYGLMITTAGAAGIDSIPETDEAMLMKQQGDQYAREGDFAKAAEVYAKALSLSSAFSDNDRFDMAKILAWGGNLDRSKGELNALLTKDPNNLKARVQLARILFWQTEMDGSLIETDKILQQSPKDRDALLLKADIARARGEFENAVSIYEELLKEEEDFEARNGLAYTYLGAGKLAEARRNFDLLEPVLPYERQEVEGLKSAITNAEKPRVLTQEDIARKTMATGNQLSDEGKHKSAAEEYLIALSLSNNFTAEERLRIASVLSWAGNLIEARQELMKILGENPSFIPARIQLARVMLWSGEFDAALKEINIVLAVAPDNRDALIVRANGLRLQKNYRPSISIYSGLVNLKDDYDAREGLTYAYLLSNDRIATDKGLPLLKPAFPYEEKSLNELKELRDVRFSPSLSPGFTFYHDNDDNDVWRYFLTGTAWFGNWKTNLDYVYTDAKDPNGTVLSDSIVLSTYSRMPFYGGIGGSVGLADSGRFITWNARGDLDIPDGSIGVRVGEEALSDTAGVSRNHIHALNSVLSVAYRPTDRIFLSASYGYRDYSDDNNAHDVMGSASYLVFRKPATIAIGYRARYLDYSRQSGGGYFDPYNFISNALFVNLSFENGPIYGYLEPYGGYQSFTRNEEGNYSWFGGGAGMIGYRFTKHLAAEATAEGGNYALGASGAYTYYQIGARLIIIF
jgi:tetratricopeptide (TPR) repeat protein